MQNINEYTKILIIILLAIILIILIITRDFILKRINKNDLEIVKDIVIGREEIQEDFLDSVTSPCGTLAVLADGLGKNEAGRLSGIIAVKTIKNIFLEEGSREKIKYFFKKAFNKVNLEIIKRVEKDKGGASVLSVIVIDNFLYYASVGNVMLSVFRKDELTKITEGHSISEVAKNAYYEGKIGRQEALYALKEKKLLHYIGEESFKDIEVYKKPIRLKKNDIIVLMTKGIYEGVRWIELEEILSKTKLTLEEKLDEIIEVAYNNNICNGSIILMRYLGNKK